MEFQFRAERKLLDGKIVIIVNGKGGVGKDTICDIVHHFFYSKHISAITPVKEIAKQCGWNGEKTTEARKFLSDLKGVLISYNQYPTEYLIQEFYKFVKDQDTDILFIDIREADQIQRFIDNVDVISNIPVRTLLVTSNRSNLPKTYGNKSDDQTESINYNYTFHNDGDLDLLEEKVWHFFVTLFQQERILDSAMPFTRVTSE